MSKETLLLFTTTLTVAVLLLGVPAAWKFPLALGLAFISAVLALLLRQAHRSKEE